MSPQTAPEVVGEVRARGLAFVRAHRLLAQGDTWAVAVSGGQDSVCLLDVLAHLARDLQVQLVVAHVNHGLRGESAEADAQLVDGLARGYGLEPVLLLADVAAYARQHHLNLQAAARSARYQLLGQLQSARKLAGVAVGHTADDAMETFLLNSLRGAGLSGLQGIASVQTLELASLGPRYSLASATENGGETIVIARPLLDVYRRQTWEYCQALRLSWREDPSNLSPAYARNRVRLEVGPALEKAKPDFRRGLIRTIRAVASDYEVVRYAVRQAWAELARTESGAVALPLEKFNALPLGLRRQLVRAAAASLRGTTANVSQERLEVAVRTIAAARAGRVSRLAADAGVWITRDEAVVATAGAWSAAPLAVSVPGETRLGDLGVLEVSIVDDPRELPRLVRSARRTGRDEALLDAEAVGDRLQARARRPGDRFTPLGMKDSKKLQDFFVDRNVPPWERDRVPLIVSPQGIAWVVGHEIAQQYRVHPSTRRAARLRFVRMTI